MDVADRAVARVGNDGDSPVVEGVVAFATGALVVARLEDFLLVLGIALLAQEVTHRANLVLAHVRSVHALEVG